MTLLGHFEIAEQSQNFGFAQDNFEIVMILKLRLTYTYMLCINIFILLYEYMVATGILRLLHYMPHTSHSLPDTQTIF